MGQQQYNVSVIQAVIGCNETVGNTQPQSDFKAQTGIGKVSGYEDANVVMGKLLIMVAN